MRTIAREAAPQIALRNCSKEEVGEGQYICDFGEGVFVKISTHFFEKVLASHEEQMSPVMILVLF